MANRTATYRMADQCTGGKLEEFVRGLLAEGRSYDQISRSLYAEHGAEVSGWTLRRWFPATTAPAAEGAA